MEKVESFIKKVGDKWAVMNHDGTKQLGIFDTREEAVKRLQQIEYFKHHGENTIAGVFSVKEATDLVKIEPGEKTLASLADLSQYVIGIDQSNE